MKFNDMSEINKSFTKDGFFAVAKLIPPDLINNMEKFITELFRSHSVSQETASQTCIRLNQVDQNLLFRIYQTCSRSIELDEIRIHLKKVIREIYPEKLYIELGAGLLMGIPGDERISYDWHQEIHYHPEIEDVVHFWLPVLGEANVLNGTMSLLHGSHRLGKLPVKLKKKVVSNSVTNLVVQNINEIKKNNSEIFVTAKPGDVIGLHSHVIHRSNQNTTEKNVRFVISCRLAAVSAAPRSFDFKVKEETLE